MPKKLRNEERERILELAKEGKSAYAIAKIMGRSEGAVSRTMQEIREGRGGGDVPPSLEELDLPVLEHKEFSTQQDGDTKIAEKTVHLDIPAPTLIPLGDAPVGTPAAPKQPEATSKELAELRESFAKQLSGIECAAYAGFTGKELSKDEKDMLYFCWKMASILIIKDVSKNDSLVWIMLIGAHVVIILAHYDDLQDAYKRKMRKPQGGSHVASPEAPPPSPKVEPKSLLVKPLPVSG
jgi:transposase-like protein